MATSSYRQCAPKVELNKDRYIIQRAVTVQGHPTNTKQPKKHKAKAKQNPHKQNKHKTTHKAKTARPVISRSVHSHLKRIRRDDNILSPLGLVWQNKTRANNKPRKCHTAICEPGSNKSTMRKPRLPPPRLPPGSNKSNSRSQSASRAGNILTDYFDTIQKPAMTLPCGKRKVGN